MFVTICMITLVAHWAEEEQIVLIFAFLKRHIWLVKAVAVLNLVCRESHKSGSEFQLRGK